MGRSGTSWNVRSTRSRLRRERRSKPRDLREICDGLRCTVHDTVSPVLHAGLTICPSESIPTSTIASEIRVVSSSISFRSQTGSADASNVPAPNLRSASTMVASQKW